MFRWKTRFPSSHSHISRSKIRRLTTPKTDSRAPIPWRGSDDWVRAGNGSQDHKAKNRASRGSAGSHEPQEGQCNSERNSRTNHFAVGSLFGFLGSCLFTRERVDTACVTPAV